MSLKRLIAAVGIGLATTWVGCVFMGVAAHGPEWSEYVPYIVMPTCFLVFQLGPYHTDWWMIWILIAQSALWYGLLSIPDTIRALASDD